MAAEDDLLVAFELHSPKRIAEALQAGAHPTTPIRGKKPIEILIEMYLRSDRFAECLQVMLDAGARLDDRVLEALLLDDSGALGRLLASEPEVLQRRFDVNGAYTSLRNVSALHVCAEFNSVNCARTLLDAGIFVDVRAETDRDGLGGQTPLFHTVNSNQNYCRPTMELLANAGADLDVRIKGLVWGGGFEWETIVFDVTPISYAQCGLYAQFHRREQDVYSNIAFLYARRYGSEPPVRNVPNKYLQPRPKDQ